MIKKTHIILFVLVLCGLELNKKKSSAKVAKFGIRGER